MRVLILCSSYPRFRNDSASIFLRHLALALSKAGIDIKVLAPDHREVENIQFDPAISVSHFRYFPRRWQTLAYGSGILPNLRQHPIRWLQVPTFLFSMFISLWQQCRKQRPDIIHAHWILPQGLIAVWVGKLLNIPVVTTAHGGDVFSLRGSLLAALKRYTLQQSQAWTANTPTTAETMVSLNTITTPAIVPMGVDVNRFCGTSPSTSLHAKKNNPQPVILFVGRLVEKKGVADLLEAFARLPEQLRSTTELQIIGDGTERANLQTRATKLEISQHVRFLGRMAHDLLPDYYTNADLFVAPSIIDSVGDTEGQGVVIIEAMASGLPVIAYETGGIKDVINNDSTGILVSPRNIDGLKNALQRLLQDASLRQRLGQEAKHYARQHYSWDIIAQQFDAIFSKLTTKAHS